MPRPCQKPVDARDVASVLTSKYHDAALTQIVLCVFEARHEVAASVLAKQIQSHAAVLEPTLNEQKAVREGKLESHARKTIDNGAKTESCKNDDGVSEDGALPILPYGELPVSELETTSGELKFPIERGSGSEPDACNAIHDSAKAGSVKTNEAASECGALQLLTDSRDKTTFTEPAVPVKDVHTTQSEGPGLVQFGSSIYYCLESEGAVVVDVTRIGPKESPCLVDYKTRDVSAKAGHKYVATSGTLNFMPGELSKEIRVSLLDDDKWDATLEFMIELSNPKDTQLGRYLYKCRVKIVDNDVFPSSKYDEELRSQAFDKIPKMKLLREYVKMNMKYPEVRWRCQLYIFCTQLESVLKITELMIKMYLTDTLVHLAGAGSQQQSGEARLWIVSAMFVLQECIVVALGRVKASLRLVGTCRNITQTNLLRKFLNYDRHVRASIHEADMIMAITRDCLGLVEKGLICHFLLLQRASTIIFLILFDIGIALLSSDATLLDYFALLLPSLIFPIAIVVFLRFRFAITANTDLRVYLCEDALSRCAQFVVEDVLLIVGFHQRPSAVDQICSKADDLNRASYDREKLLVTNTRFGWMIMTLMLCGYLLYAGGLLIGGNITVAQVLARVQSLSVSAAAWNMAYRDLLLLQSSIPALEIVVRYLNFSTDLRERMAVHRDCSRINLLKRQQMKHEVQGNGNQINSDRIPIELTAVKFSHRAQEVATVHKSLSLRVSSATLESPSARKALSNNSLGSWDLQIQQGSLVALVGNHGEGKSTLLRIIGSVILASEGTVFVPPHLRVYYVSQVPMFLANASIYENLVYGSDLHNEADTSMERVLQICRKMDLPEHVVKLVQKGMSLDLMELSLSEKMQLHIVRVLVANPEVITIAKPTLAFDNKRLIRTMEAFREHVAHKGLFISDSKPRSRRPRTLIFTAARANAVEMADDIYLVGRSGVSKIAAADVLPGMLE